MKKLIRTAAQVVLALLIIPFVLEKPVHSLLESVGVTGEYSYEILLGMAGTGKAAKQLCPESQPL